MKNKSIYLLFIVLFLSFSYHVQSSKKNTSTTIEQNNKADESQMIKNFYVSYASNVANGLNSKNDALLTENMTPELIAKIQRMRAATQGDPIIRAQDFNLKDINSFDVKHLKGEWYMVSYIQNSDKKSVEIPVKITNVKGKYLIDYITPQWNNFLYGDDLLCEQNTAPKTIDPSSPMSLLKTFYDAYTNEYCSMPLDLENRLEVLCKNYCTKNCLDKIKESKENTPAYDLVIDYFDFDKLWQPTLTFTHLKGDSYKVSYKKWQNIITNIYVSIIKKDGKYFIDDIRVDGEH